MSFLTELEKHHLKKANLTSELKSLRKREKALRETVKILEEKLAVKELACPSLPIKPLEWCSSPEKVRSLYTS